MAKKPLEIDMIAGSQLRDTQGEMLSVEGADISELEAGRGRFNDNHGKGFFNSVGRVTSAKKIYGPDDFTDPRHEYFWDKVKAPYIYVRGYLYDDEDHGNAKAAAAILRNIHKSDTPLKLKASVEGGVVQRGLKDETLLARTKIHSVALTFTPANNATLVEPYQMEKSADTEADMLLIKSVMHLAQTDIPSFRAITRNAQAEKIYQNMEKIREIAAELGLGTELVKAFTPEQLIKEALEMKIHGNIQKIHELVKGLPDYKKLNELDSNLENAHYHLKAGNSKMSFTGKDAIDAQDHAYNAAPHKQDMKNEHGEMEPHVLMFRGVNNYKQSQSKKNNSLYDAGTHVDANSNTTGTMHSPEALSYASMGDYPPDFKEENTKAGMKPNTFAYWVPKSKIHSTASYLQDKMIEGGQKDYTAEGDDSHVSHHPGKYLKATKNELKVHLQADKWSKNESMPYLDDFNQEHSHPENLKKALTAGYGGGGAPTSQTGGSVLQSESLDDGRPKKKKKKKKKKTESLEKGMKYMTCGDCGHEQVYMKHQVKCRKCNKHQSLQKLLSVML